MTENPLLLAACLMLAVCCGLLLGWWARGLQSRTHQAEAGAAVADLETQLAHSQNEALLLQGKYDQAVQAAALLHNEQQDQAELSESLAPITSSLARLERQMSTTEQATHKSWGQLVEQITQVSRNTESLQEATSSLSAALSSSSSRGVWGEVQLKRLLEHAGMSEHVDFDTQVSVTKGDATVRPDAVIHLPDGKTLVVDAKAPLAAYLRAAEAQDPKAQLTEHTKALKKHVRGLASKEYWAAFEASPEFVVCFLPHEAMLSAACSQDPAIIEEAAAAGVVLTTPATLLAVLRTVAMVWQQDRLTHNIQEVFDTGRELHNRLSTLSGRMTSLGKSLQRSVEDYNKLVGSAESRVFPAAKKLIQQGMAAKEVETPVAVKVTPRPLASPQWQGTLDAARGDIQVPGPDELITPPHQVGPPAAPPVLVPAPAGSDKPGAGPRGVSVSAQDPYSAQIPAAQSASSPQSASFPVTAAPVPLPPVQAGHDSAYGDQASTKTDRDGCHAPPTVPVTQTDIPDIPVAE